MGSPYAIREYTMSTCSDFQNLSYKEIKLEESHTSIFYPLFQSGLKIPISKTGCSLKNLLCHELLIPEKYVQERITTIFCDNHPVDNMEQTFINHGSRLALSAAMPGLVGATMRRGGYYALLRAGISQISQNQQIEAEQGVITVKLFNLLLPELAPTFLARGIFLECENRKEVFEKLNIKHLSGNELADENIIFRISFIR